MGITKLTKEFIETRMAELKIKQSHIVSQTGNSKSAISNWVNGVSEPKGQELFRFLKALKLSLIDGEIVKNDYAGIEVPVISTSELNSKSIVDATDSYATREKDVEFIISVNTHNFLFPFGSKLYIKRFNGKEDFKNNMFVVVEDDNKKLKIAKLTFFNESYYISHNSDLTAVELKNIKYKISLVKL
ncbi:helix-turn-helix domain-containing protein [Francisella philomiragia]|uniref:Helix-turn-helix family protein n=1 Tax=Francisella philomiragia TaxID=28110 RepID=A0A0B6CQM2_9GAMM|nr:helix-turn-helix domain-containing protein [Francisella philomiragia]AJI52769.1 helix-turn-helix family protein [Francisella philomiragia]